MAKTSHRWLTLSQRKNLDSSQLKEFTDDNFKCDKKVENSPKG